MGPFEVLLFSKAKQRNTFIIQLRPPVLRRGFGALRGAQRRSSQTATPPALLSIPPCCATLTAQPRAPCPLLGSPGLGPPFLEPRGFPQPPQGSSWRWVLHLSTPGGAGTLGGTGGCERDRAPIPNYTRVPCSSRPTLGLCFTGTAKQVLRGYKKTLKPGRARRARSSANEISARALAYCHRAYVSQQTMLSPEESRHKEHHNSGPNPKQGVTRLSPCPRGSPRGALAPNVAEQPRGACVAQPGLGTAPPSWQGPETPGWAGRHPCLCLPTRGTHFEHAILLYRAAPRPLTFY